MEDFFASNTNYTITWYIWWTYEECLTNGMYRILILSISSCHRCIFSVIYLHCTAYEGNSPKPKWQKTCQRTPRLELSPVWTRAWWLEATDFWTLASGCTSQCCKKHLLLPGSEKNWDTKSTNNIYSNILKPSYNGIGRDRNFFRWRQIYFHKGI